MDCTVAPRAVLDEAYDELPAFEQLPASIIACHHEAQNCAARAIEYAVNCGLCLLKAKQHVTHGEWDTWLAENITFSARTARSYMFLAKHKDRIEQTGSSDANLTIREALRVVGPSRKSPECRIEQNSGDVECSRPDENPAPTWSTFSTIKKIHSFLWALHEQCPPEDVPTLVGKLRSIADEMEANVEVTAIQ